MMLRGRWAFYIFTGHLKRSDSILHPLNIHIILDVLMDHFHIGPVSPMDTHSGGAHLTLTLALVFSGVIDEARLRAAVSKLARAWPMLGSRLRRAAPEAQAIEALVPEADHAKLATTFNIVPKSLHEAETLPTRTSTISTQLLTRNTSLYYHNPQPCLEHYLSTQCPAFHLHISILTDATVLSLTFPHVLMDAGGASEVMRGLVGALEGKDPKPQLEGDPWADIAALSKDGEPTRGWSTYGPKEFALAQDVESNDLDRDGPIRQRTIYFPYAEIERLKNEAMRELEWIGVKVPFLSSGDVIVAWLYKQFYGDELYSPERTSRLLYILDARLRLPDTFPSTHVHLKNGYLVLAAQAHANSTISSLSLGEVALMARELVNEGSRRDEIGKGVGWKYENVEGVRVPAPAGERVLFASNWLTFGLGELNFASVVRPGSGTGKVLDVYCGMPGIPRCSGVITYRDSDGGVSAAFDWGERNWTSGTIGEFAIEKLSILNSLQVGSKERNGEERVIGVIEKGVWTWKTVQSLISWWRRLLHL